MDYALEAAIFVTGAAVQWLRDALGLIETAAETEELAGWAGPLGRAKGSNSWGGTG